MESRVAASSFLYVKPSGTGDCSSWTEACLLQIALVQAEYGEEIWAAKGVYYPDEGIDQSDNDRSSTFQLKPGVAMYGGFVGGEIVRSDRVWEKNITVLSGDLEDDDTTDTNGVITNTANITGTNTRHVVTGHGITETAVVDGFTVTGGHASGPDWPDYTGAGMFNSEGSPTLTNVTFSGNKASSAAGGMFNSKGSPILTNVTFNGNEATRGGGIFNREGNPILTAVTFSTNSANEGGGMYNEGDSPTLNEVTFDGNRADVHGGGLYNEQGNPKLTKINFNNNRADNFGGGLYNEQGNPKLTNVTFNNNKAFFEGGGLFNMNGNPTLTDVTFDGNWAQFFGGGMASWTGSPILTNVTFSSNSAVYIGGGGIYSAVGIVQVKNSIIAGNTLGEGSSVSDSDVNGAFTSLGYNLIGDATGSTGFSHDVNDDQVGSGAAPIDPVLGDLALNPPGSTATMALLTGSPAIDKGSCQDFTTDQRGAARPVDIPTITNVEEGDGCDIGAYEVQIATANFEGSPISGLPPLTVSFRNLSSGDYSSCQWDFGDNTTSSDCENPEHVYAAVGSYPVSLKITGAGGSDTESKEDYIVVLQAPKADFEGTPLTGVAPLTVSFKDMSSGHYSSCHWDFGDSKSSDSCNDPEHVYDTAGTYSVSLKVSGAAGDDTEEKVDYLEVSANIFLPIITRGDVSK